MRTREARMQLRPCIAELFPASVVAEVQPLRDCWDELDPREQEGLSAAVSRRKSEYATGRICAMKLLLRLGRPGVRVGRRADGMPLWPDGIVGTIAHAAGICVVAVANASNHAGLGVDVEPDEALESEIWARICTGVELDRLQFDSKAERGRRVRHVFSAKESVFKCQYPLTGVRLDFRDIEIRWMDGSTSFHAEYVGAKESIARIVGGLRGRIRCESGLILTSAILARSPWSPEW